MKLGRGCLVAILCLGFGGAQKVFLPDACQADFDKVEGCFNTTIKPVADLAVADFQDEAVACPVYETATVETLQCAKLCSAFSCTDDVERFFDGVGLVIFQQLCGPVDLEKTCTQGVFVSSSERMKAEIGLILAASLVAVTLNR